jgi:DNA-directed RNA polymerase subunit beta
MLTIKSDDVVGRAKAFEAIVKGTDIPTPRVPESFKVLMKELQALSLNVVPVGAQIEEKSIVEPEAMLIAEEKVEEQAKELEKELGGEEGVASEGEEGISTGEAGEEPKESEDPVAVIKTAEGEEIVNE